MTSATAALPITLTPRLMRVLILSLLLAVAGYLGLALATGWDDTWRAVAHVGAEGVALLAVVVLIAAAPLLGEWGARGQNGWLTRALAWGARILAQAKNCLVPQRLLPGWGLGCCAYAAQGLSFHLMLVAMGYDIGLPVAIFVFAFASLVGALSFIPGGLGTADATVFFLLVHFGVTEPEAASATVLIRVTTLWFAVAVGLASAGWLTFRKADKPSAT